MCRGQGIRKNPQRRLRRKGHLGKDFNYEPWNLSCLRKEKNDEWSEGLLSYLKRNFALLNDGLKI